MARAFLGVGSNEGDRLALISRALRLVAALPSTRLERMATLLETAPAGGPPQGPYLNTVVLIETTLEPEPLLRALQDIERACGREPGGIRWGPRTMDLDILSYDDRQLTTAVLTLPHPRLHERRFVLEPLVQIAPDWVHPGCGRRAVDLLQDLPVHNLPGPR